MEKLPSSDVLEALFVDSLSVVQRKRVEVEEKGRKKFVTQIADTEMNKASFKVHFEWF